MPSQKATVLILELPGFAELSGKLGEKELHSLLNALNEQANAGAVKWNNWKAFSSNCWPAGVRWSILWERPVSANHAWWPGYKETGDYILKYLEDHFPENYISIYINPLNSHESGKLIHNLLRKAHLPEDIATMIIRKTEGNPFFMEEVIRSFFDEGIIEIHDKEFRVTEKIREANIPETINEVILSRVDKLDEKTKELLKTASVIGRNFYFKILEEAADTIGELDERLEYLKEAQQSSVRVLSTGKL